MNIKKLTGFGIISILIVMLLVGCGKSKGSSEKKSETKESKKILKVGMEIAYPPFEYYEEDGKTIAGFDYELIQAVGKEIGYEVEIVPVSWDGIFAGLDKCDYDCIVSAITITPERVKKYSFTTPYIKNYQCIVTTSKAKKKPKSMEDLKGLEVGYQEESTSDTLMTDYIEAKKVKCSTKEYSKIIDTFSDLKLGRLDAILCDSTVAEQYCAGGDYKITWKQDKDPEEFGICLPKDSKLVEEMNKALKKLTDDGTIKKIKETYFSK